ncbi:MAG: hypothetical protein H7067_07390 [Burkholderiales bacterium]|nr:hypothetical protein [Opitutaceae bacterium]
MSVPVASFLLTANSGAYTYTISSCNPAQPVSFQIGNEPYDPTRLSQSGYLGGRYGALLSIATFPQVPVPTTPDQNPIKLILTAITSDQGEPTGSTAVFYGYYTQPYAGGLGFYLNQQQSQRYFQTGMSGIAAAINESAPSIAVG